MWKVNELRGSEFEMKVRDRMETKAEIVEACAVPERVGTC
jgi:hypothetical protein